jgi:hypothetical protein
MGNQNGVWIVDVLPVSPVLIPLTPAVPVVNVCQIIILLLILVVRLVITAYHHPQGGYHCPENLNYLLKALGGFLTAPGPHR